MSSRVLVVEDETVIALDLQRILTRLGYEIAGLAASGEDALRKAAATHPDIVLMDIGLHGAMDGIQTAEVMNNQLAIPVIFITAYGDPATLAQAKLSAPYGYILKPYNERILHVTIETALERRRLEARARQSESLARQNEAFLRAVIENTDAAIWSLDTQFHLLTWNSAFLRQWEGENGPAPLAEQDLARLDYFGLASEEWRQLYERAMQGERIVVEKSTPVAIRLNNWFELSVTPIRDSDGNIGGVSIFMRDITQKKYAAEALRYSEELLELFFAQSLDGFFFMMLDEPVDWSGSADKEALMDYIFAHQRMTKVNQAMADQYRVSREQLLGLTPNDMFAHDIPTGKRIWVQMLDAGRLHIETDERRFDGEPMWVEGDYICIYNGEGWVLGHFGIQREITQRKDSEETLKRRLSQLRVINQIGRQVASLLDLAGVVQRAAQLIQEQFGYHHVGLFLQTGGQGDLQMRARAGQYTDLFPEDHRLKMGQGMVGWCGQHGETLLANNVHEERRYINLYPDRIPTQSELCVPIRVGDEPRGVLDIQSPEIGAFGREDVLVMETLADQIAIAVENARLYEQVRSDADQRATLLHEVNHRVSNNFSALLGLLGMEDARARRQGNYDYVEFLTEISSRVQGLASVHRMFAAARWSPVGVSDLADQILAGVIKLAPIDKKLDYSIEPSEIMILPRQANALALILNELATNSMKYALRDRARVLITVRFERLDDNRALMVFRDSGPGYSQENIHWIGVNTGLSLVRTLAEVDLSGTVSLASDGGAIATVIFKSEAPSGLL